MTAIPILVGAYATSTGDFVQSVPVNKEPVVIGSGLLNRIPAGMAWGPFDMYGTAIDNTGLGAAGAYQ